MLGAPTMTAPTMPPPRPHSRPRTRLQATADALGSPATWGRLGMLAVIVVSCAVLVAALLAPVASLADSTLATAAAGVDFGPLPGFTETAERSTVLDRDGNVIAVLREENRTLVDLDEVPEHVVAAVVATEDDRFREHEGVNWRAVARAAVGNLGAGEITSGASTITQQLVKKTVVGVGEEQTFARKLREGLLLADAHDGLLDQLLGDGGGATGDLAGSQVADRRACHRPPVHALVLAEAIIFGGDHRSDHVLGHLVQVHQGAV